MSSAVHHDIQAHPLTFNTIYKQYYKRAIAFVKSYIHDDLATEDIVSEAMISVWKNIDLNRKEGITAYLLCVLKSRTLDYLRCRKRELQMKEDVEVWMNREVEYQTEALESCTTDGIFKQEILDIAKNTLETLPEKTRLVFEMSRNEALTHREIADKLGVSEKAVQYHITRALKALHKTLRNYLPIFLFLFGA
ncbi:putative trp operon repressor [Prevotella sp. DNF00663]|uniref:RNA polymerase sigma-70 factor n=1 Tax=unclassified Prevotella TaxID=2638335 RepID=UPI000689555D|nr:MULTISPECIES: RNA polymerase sigma-70 factor [unclassified Prevotella]KXB78715.1 putative trp operon repressor [Prevotella sp. DNF00663]